MSGTRCTARTSVLCAILLASLNRLVGAFNLDTTQPIFFSGPTRSYFGYSVDVMTLQDRPYVIVGSPKANMSWMKDIPEPGGVFQCDASKKCDPITIDTGIIQRVLMPLTEPFKDRKDGQWLGSTVRVLASNQRPQIAACAPRWKNVIYDGSVLMSGMCYLKTLTATGDTPATMLRPLLDVSKIVFSEGGYGFGQTGMSAVFSGKMLVMGATGLDEGIGGVAKKIGKKLIVTRKIVNAKNSYLGYSLAVGQLDIDRRGVLVGGPGYHKLGLVKVLRDDLRWQGDQVGSYFGSSICTIDTNGDSLPEVVIGAPLYSMKEATECGIVYVYLNSEFDRISKDPVQQLTGSGAARARFGTSLSHVGDLNMDEYNDLAVGAPFEDDWSGCVYIYNGSPNGLTTEFSQRICGGNLQSDLRGFGWSISPPIDMDNNMYKDFAVGAFISDDTVLLRARPIIDMKPTFTVTPKVIDQMSAPGRCAAINTDAYCVTVKICFTFDVVGDPDSRLTADVNFTLACDTRKRSGETGRARFVENGKPGKIKLTKTKGVFTSPKVTCDEIVAVIELTSDLLTPITFEAEYNLIPASLASSNQISPILNQFSERKLIAEATFRLSCGSDNECLTDVSLHLRPVAGLPHSGYFISGQDNPATIAVTIWNRGESAYETLLTTDLPNTVQYTGNKWGASASVIRCSKASVQQVHCIMGNPVKENTTLVGELIINGRNIHPRTKQLTFRANVTTTSQDTNSNNNQRIVISFVRLKADMDIRGESTPEQTTYTPAKIAKQKEGFGWRELNFTHDVTIHNKGPSLLPKAKITILIPVKNDELFACYYDNKIQLTFADETAGSKQSCTVYDQLIEPGGVNLSTPATTASPTKDSVHTTALPTTAGPKTGESIGKQVVNRRRRAADGRRTNVHVVDCAHYSCLRIVCVMEYFPAGSTALFNISLGLYEEKISTLTEEGSVIRYQSTVYIQPQDKDEFAPLLDRTPISAKVTSTLNAVTAPPGSVALWIIIVSAIAGLILLIILGIILWKCGFFKRKKHMEVKQWKRTSTIRKSTYVADTELDMRPEVVEPDEVQPRPPSHYTVSPSEEQAPELQNKDPLPQSKSNPRPVSLALPEHTEIGDSMELLPPPPDNV